MPRRLPSLTNVDEAPPAVGVGGEATEGARLARVLVEVWTLKALYSWGSLTKAFKTDFMSINPPDLHHGQQGRQEGRGLTDKERAA